MFHQKMNGKAFKMHFYSNLTEQQSVSAVSGCGDNEKQKKKTITNLSGHASGATKRTIQARCSRMHGKLQNNTCKNKITKKWKTNFHKVISLLNEHKLNKTMKQC